MDEQGNHTVGSCGPANSIGFSGQVQRLFALGSVVLIHSLLHYTSPFTYFLLFYVGITGVPSASVLFLCLCLSLELRTVF
jgi:hypothetical protein